MRSAAIEGIRRLLGVELGRERMPSDIIGTVRNGHDGLLTPNGGPSLERKGDRTLLLITRGWFTRCAEDRLPGPDPTSPLAKEIVLPETALNEPRSRRSRSG